MDVWLPEGTKIEETDRQVMEMSEYIRGQEETEIVSTYIGRTPPRYYLSNVSFGPQSNYAQILVKCKTSELSRQLHTRLQDSISLKYPEPLIKVNKFELSPLTEAVIEARFLGPDPAVLDSLVGQAIEVMRRNPKVADARNEWGNMSLVIRPVYDPVKAGALGITKASMMQSVKSINDGLPVGIYRDDEKKVPVLLKSGDVDITDVNALGDFSIWNGERSAPLSQVTERIERSWEFPQVRTYNRQLSMAAMCGVKPGYTMSEVHGEIRKEIEKIHLPEGYTFFWDSQYKDQGEAMQAIAKYFPLAFLALIVILVALFGNFREPVIILCILPLSLIGIAVGMLLTGFDFGFFPIAGWLGLLGMIIKNVIVLIDEINVQHRSGIDLYTSIVEATVSRTRPVLMAATTTIFGMVPLLFDKSKKDKKKTAIKAIESVGIGDLTNKAVNKLSGGQKQRLCIARALIKKAKILILDDSSSALDYATDAKLRHALLNFDNSLTIFMISQRTSSLMHCDQILVLDNGELVGIGTHEELLNNCEVYKEIYNSQFSSEVNEDEK